MMIDYIYLSDDKKKLKTFDDLKTSFMSQNSPLDKLFEKFSTFCVVACLACMTWRDLVSTCYETTRNAIVLSNVLVLAYLPVSLMLFLVDSVLIWLRPSNNIFALSGELRE